MNSLALNTHTVAISAAPEKVYPQIIQWGEAPWWPKKSRMRFIRTRGETIQEGTRYRQRVLLPCAPSWDVEIQGVTPRSITRAFLNGMFLGYETVSVSPAGPPAGPQAGPQAGAGTQVLYEMHYQVRGFFNRMLWPIAFEKMHDANIKAILKNLKSFVEGDKGAT
jgi:hypothetical protein